MFPLSVISNRRPFAPVALPAFIATMGASDSQTSPSSSSLFRLVRGCAPNFMRRCLGLLGYRAIAMSGSLRLSIPGGLHRLANTSGNLLPAGVLKPSARSHASFRDSSPSRSALPVTIAPRLLSCLRIKCGVTDAPARLDTWPVASGFQGGTSTRSVTRHCQAATKT
jgi:hypothetical protein